MWAGVCPIYFDRDSRTNLYLLIYGFMQGLYHSDNYPTQMGCTRCRDVALPFANMQRGLAQVLEFFSDLLSDNAFGEMSGPDQLMMLYDSFLIFHQFGANFSALINNNSIVVMYNQFLATFDTDYVGALRNNFLKNAMGLSMIFASTSRTDIDCKQNGVLYGALMRKAFSYQFIN